MNLDAVDMGFRESMISLRIVGSSECCSPDCPHKKVDANDCALFGHLDWHHDAGQRKNQRPVECLRAEILALRGRR